MNTKVLLAVWRAMRPPFLLLTLASVLLGWGTVAASLPDPLPGRLFIVLVGAICAHISVNALNEYLDYRSGLDLRTEATPFSGGSKALVIEPRALTLVGLAAALSLAVTILSGLWLVAQTGMALVPIGIAGVMIIVTYTSWLNRQPWLCLVAPGLAFGPLMVVGSALALSGTPSASVWLAAAVPFFLANNLLLLNQWPDRIADASVGRRHFPIAYGEQASLRVYALSAAGAGIAIVAGVLSGSFASAALLATLPLLACLQAFRVARHAQDTAALLPALRWNVIAALATPSVLGLSLWLGR
ncbi:MAG: prenyltransferase [Burkholderiaceae bacterium]